MRVLSSKGRHYGNFLTFRFHWALLACLRWSLGTLGLPWMPLDCLWASICHPRGSIGAPRERRWAPFVAVGDPLGRLLGVIGFKFGHKFLIGAQVEGLERVQKLGGILKKKTKKSVRMYRYL